MSERPSLEAALKQCEALARCLPECEATLHISTGGVRWVIRTPPGNLSEGPVAAAVASCTVDAAVRDMRGKLMALANHHLNELHNDATAVTNKVERVRGAMDMLKGEQDA